MVVVKLTGAAAVERRSLDAGDRSAQSEARTVPAAGITRHEDGGLVVAASGAGEEIEGRQGGSLLDGAFFKFCCWGNGSLVDDGGVGG